jgi:hypothetical protein
MVVSVSLTITLGTAAFLATPASAAPAAAPTQVRVNHGMRACSAGSFAPFNTATAGYEDNVVSWPSVEPADDYSAASLFAFALGGAGLG